MARSRLSTTTAILAIAAVLILAATRAAEGAITCPQVYGEVNLCISYLRKGGTPTPACCRATRSLLAAIHTVQDRRKACMCLKIAAAGVHGLKPANAVSLPSKCGIFYPLKFKQKMDCSRIN